MSGLAKKSWALEIASMVVLAGSLPGRATVYQATVLVQNPEVLTGGANHYNSGLAIGLYSMDPGYVLAAENVPHLMISGLQPNSTYSIVAGLDYGGGNDFYGFSLSYSYDSQAGAIGANRKSIIYSDWVLYGQEYWNDQVTRTYWNMDSTQSNSAGEIHIYLGDRWGGQANYTAWGEFYVFSGLLGLKSPTFSPGSGQYSSPQTVTISCATEGATIHYTIGSNPSDPTESDPIYDPFHPITIDNSTQQVTILKAQAYKAGMYPSTVAFASYNFSAIRQIALGKSYTFSISPNYQSSIDPPYPPTGYDDLTQLTDGFARTDFPFWTQTTTVGWDKDQACSPIQITIDLGESKAISGASFNTAGGSSGVEWPEAIYLLTSDDGQNFEYINDLVAMSNLVKGPPPTSGVYKYETHGLQTHGRYVRLVVAFRQCYTFVDEIELYEGDPAWLTQPRQAFADLNPFISGKMMTLGVRRTMQKDIDAIRTKTNASSISSSAKTYIVNELNAVQANIPNVDVPYSTTFRAILPFNTDHDRIFKAQAYYWEALGRSGVRSWNSTLWDSLSEGDDPPSSDGASVSVDMMNGEYRAGAFNLSNSTQSDKSITMTIAGLPGGDNPSYITVHDVTWTDTKSNQPVAAALPIIGLVSGSYPITLKSGLTKQIWLTFHPVGFAPGSYTGQIQLRGDATLDIPISFTLRDYQFPSRPTLGFGGWDYVNNPSPSYAITSANKNAFLAQLKDHFVNSPWATSGVMPYGTFNANGTLVFGSISTVSFNAWIADWPGTSADYYYVFLNCGDQIGQFSITNPTFNTAVRSWLTFWANYISGRGLNPAKFRLCVVDEPDSSYSTRIIAWANAIHAANKGFKVWENSYKSYSQLDPNAMNTCDTLCPTRSGFIGDQALQNYFVGFLQTPGKELQFYSVSGQARLLDPYAWFRLSAWSCWKYGAKAMHFWSFGQTANDWYWQQATSAIKSSWNEYVSGYLWDSNAEYTPFFIDNTTVTPGKHMEACREGVEDYEYFVILKGLVDQAIALGKSGEPLTRSQNLLATLPSQVLSAESAYMWSDTAVDRTAADSARGQLLGAIVDLKNLIYFSLTGTVVLNDYPPNPSGVQVSVQLRKQGGSTASYTPTLNAAGQFTISGIAPGTYDVWVKASHWLAKLQMGIVVASSDVTIPLAFSLVNGDCDGNNTINELDLAIVLNNMEIPSGFEPRTDLDGDGEITSTDLSVVLFNLDRFGD